MDTIIKTVEEAKTWFTENTEGSVTVENSKGEQKSCSTLAEAEAFLAEGNTAAGDQGASSGSDSGSDSDED